MSKSTAVDKQEKASTKVVTTVSLPPDTTALLDDLAQRSHRSRSQVIDLLVRYATKDKTLAHALVGVIE